MNTTKPQEIFFKGTHGVGRQDKQPPGRLTAGSSRSATAETSEHNRPTHHGSETRRTVQTTGRVLPHIKTAILHKAKANGWTESKALATLVEIGIEHDLGEQLWVRIAAKIEDAVYRAVQKHGNREAKLDVKGFLAAEQARIISIHTLRYILGREGIGELPHIIEDSQHLAWSNLKHHLNEEHQPQP
jgi:hypothetical protein